LSSDGIFDSHSDPPSMTFSDSGHGISPRLPVVSQSLGSLCFRLLISGGWWSPIVCLFSKLVSCPDRPCLAPLVRLTPIAFPESESEAFAYPQPRHRASKSGLLLEVKFSVLSRSSPGSGMRGLAMWPPLQLFYTSKGRQREKHSVSVSLGTKTGAWSMIPPNASASNQCCAMSRTYPYTDTQLNSSHNFKKSKPPSRRHPQWTDSLAIR
jgi:hypothetical protein